MSEELNPSQEAKGSGLNSSNNKEGTTTNNNNGSEAAPPAPAAAANNNEGAPPPSRGIVSSENSVASNSTASTKAAALAAANTKDTNVPEKEGKDGVTTKTEEPSTSTSSTSNETKTTTTSNGNSNNDHMLQMATPPHYPVAEFLFQLTKMLTDDNKEFIEWKHASILVHDPPGLEKQILPKYFRHSNYSSFQRQMNYFGFRKIAGKGKMAACSYVNENATEDISSLLYIKRKKTGVSSSAAKLLAQANKLSRVQGVGMGGLDPATAMGLMNPMMMMNGGMNPMMMGMAAGGGMMAGLNAQQQLALMQQQQQNANLMGLNGVSLQGMNGLQQGMNLQGAMGGGINALPNMMLASQAGQGAGNPLNDARLREQQQILVQLQQAHASASSGLNSSSMGNNNLSNTTNQALKNNFGLNGLQGSAHILTNDQGNLYTGGNAQFMANAAAGNNAQALLQMQQAAAMSGLGSFPQAANGAAAPGDNNGLDAANFRSFLNQQISMFAGGNPPAAAAAKGEAATMMAQGETNAAPGTSVMSNLPQGLPGNLPQGLSYEQFFQLNGVANGASAAAATAAAGAEAQQQLLSRSGNA